MYGGCKQYRPYFNGRIFTIATENNPLTWVFNVKVPRSSLLRWKLKLEEYYYQDVYKPGVRNTNADALSRITMTRISPVAKNNLEIT